MLTRILREVLPCFVLVLLFVALIFNQPAQAQTAANQPDYIDIPQSGPLQSAQSSEVVISARCGTLPVEIAYRMIGEDIDFRLLAVNGIRANQPLLLSKQEEINSQGVFNFVWITCREGGEVRVQFHLFKEENQSEERVVTGLFEVRRNAWYVRR